MGGRTRDERALLSDGTIATEPILRKIDGKPFVDGPKIVEALDRPATRESKSPPGSATRRIRYSSSTPTGELSRREILRSLWRRTRSEMQQRLIVGLTWTANNSILLLLILLSQQSQPTPSAHAEAGMIKILR